MADGSKLQARVFGEVADEYDRVRPGYPAQLVDDVLTYAGPGHSPALEVGAGTGKATAAFARRGVAIDAVEPDEAMAAVLTKRVSEYPGVTVLVRSFEDVEPARPYGLLFSAQAWHWTDPASRSQRAAAALAPGGALALFWNNDYPADEAARAALRELVDEFAPSIETSGPIDADLTADWPYVELAQHPGFGELEVRLYEWERHVSTEEFVAVLSTYSAFRMLDEDLRAALFAGIAARLGQQIVLAGQTALYLARRH